MKRPPVVGRKNRENHWGIARGATIGRGARRRFEPRPVYAGELEAQARLLLALREQIERTHPSLLTAFQMQIRRAMQSRQLSD